MQNYKSLKTIATKNNLSYSERKKVNMAEATELTVTIKSSEASYKQKFLLHDQYTISANDPTVALCIKETLANSKIEPEDITVRIVLVVQ